MRKHIAVLIIAGFAGGVAIAEDIGAPIPIPERMTRAENDIAILKADVAQLKFKVGLAVGTPAPGAPNTTLCPCVDPACNCPTGNSFTQATRKVVVGYRKVCDGDTCRIEPITQEVPVSVRSLQPYATMPAYSQTTYPLVSESSCASGSVTGTSLGDTIGTTRRRGFFGRILDRIRQRRGSGTGSSCQ
jgi:hypothetical protein